MTTQQQEAPQYELTLQDLQDYLAFSRRNKCRNMELIVGIAGAQCGCLGASALIWKYPGKLFRMPFGSNATFYCTNDDESGDPPDYYIDEGVSAILCQFDRISVPLDDNGFYSITYRQLEEAAHSRYFPLLAQLFSSSSQEGSHAATV